MTNDHAEWVQRIEAEVEGELSFAERAALARHLMTCTHCAGARASHLELRAAMASSAGNPEALTLTRPPLGRRARVVIVIIIVIAAAVVGWLAHATIGFPGPGTLERSRATIVTP